MREIKFRAWDKLNKKIVTSGLSINLDTTDRVMPISFSQGDLAYCRDNDVSSVPNIHTDIELMQYTGMKDKHGVEIYEGDLIKKSTGGIICAVGFSEGSFKLEHKDHCKSNVSSWKESELAIIGNIYENPELIESK